VLVTIRDDQPVPKIIDFGVAKATAQRLTGMPRISGRNSSEKERRLDNDPYSVYIQSVFGSEALQ
jgi:hypothetical protein